MSDPECPYISLLPPVERALLHRATLLLGTDKYIKQGTKEQETRVGITPAQARALIQWLAQGRVQLSLLVVAGAGERAGFSDTDYEAAGAHIIGEEDVASLDCAPDVVHSLKEPSTYEARIPGEFIRIGALHTGVFEPDSGLAELLRLRRVAGVFDGSAIGGHAYKWKGGYSIPIRGSMSQFAGEIAADRVLEHARSVEAPRIIISGGGIAGVAAADRLLTALGAGQNIDIVVVEAIAAMASQLAARFAGADCIEVITASTIPARLCDGADGLILTAFVPGKPAPKVVSSADLVGVRRGAVVIDVAIDEQGSIAHNGFETAAAAIAALGLDMVYVAETNMPRRFPREASEMHGRAVLPYLGVLLREAALRGSPQGAVEYIKHVVLREAASYYDALLLDLRDGLAFDGPDPVGINQRVVKTQASVMAFLLEAGLLMRSLYVRERRGPLAQSSGERAWRRGIEQHPRVAASN